MKRLLLSLLIAPPLLAQQQQARSAGSISIPFEKYTLNNGLTVVLSEDHTTPTVGVGGSNNGQTYFDWTRYWETDPSNYLETALWLEADRMGFLLDSLDDKKFRAQRDIVKNERRQSYDNQPYGRDRELIGLAMYPNGHPYSWPTIGAMSDLSAAGVEDVKRFFRLYYCLLYTSDAADERSSVDLGGR